MSALVEKALRDIWGQPSQDYQQVVQPARITASGGAFKQFNYFNRRIPLPNYGVDNDRSYFHVFEIGSVALTVLSLPNTVIGNWIAVDELCNTSEQIVDVIMETGTMVPRHHCFIGVSQEGSLFIAIRKVNQVDFGDVLVFNPVSQTYVLTNASLSNQGIFVRFYDGAIKTLPSWSGANPNPVTLIYRKINGLNDFTTFMAQAQAIETSQGLIGKTLWYVDGFIENKPMGYSNRFEGRVLGFYADRTYARFDFIKFSDIPMFTSQRDFGRVKYIVTLKGDQQVQTYLDDVDFFLVSKSDDTYKGISFNRVRTSSIRMLTHNTFALSAQVIDFQKTSHPFLSQNDFYLLCCVRTGGMDNQLVYEHQRLSELYLLNGQQRLSAMSGTNGSPMIWRAATLEQSDFVRTMEAERSELITLDVATQTYGYYSALFMLNNPFVQTVDVGGVKQITLPEAHRFVYTQSGTTNRSVFMYDQQGLLLGFFEDQQVGTTLVTAPDNNTHYAECFMMNVDANLTGIYYNQNVSGKDLVEYGYRCYVSTLDENDLPFGDWEDITDGNLYTFTDGTVPTITWDFAALTANGLYPAVHVPSKILHYPVDLAGLLNAGYIKFSVGAEQPVGNTTQFAPQTLALGHVDVFLDGESLIRDIDYFMNWPEICIAKRPIDFSASTVLTVRAYGTCDPVTAKPYATQQVGFAKDGLIGVNQQYDLIAGRAKRVIVGRRFVNPDDVRHADLNTGMVVPDGSPYLIQDYELPVESFCAGDSVTLRQRDRVSDEMVANYLQSRLPEPTPINPSIEGDVVDLFSPFLSSIIFAFDDGFLNNGELDQPYTNLDVEAWITDFKFLLAYDPCLKDLDFRYVTVYPHIKDESIAVTASQYGFLSYLVFNYLDNRVNLSLMLTVSE